MKGTQRGHTRTDTPVDQTYYLRVLEIEQATSSNEREMQIMDI